MTNTPEQPQSSRLDRIEAVVASNAEAIANNTQAIAELRQELGESISHLVGVIGDFAEEAQQDRVVFQAEIRRIWEYLLQR
ncbi:hypothetical protein VB735_15185 [Halotia wernerae UHCC 0503]|nr:hypothetical protein [Halotia wernerae UHCC 0503]